VTGIRISGRATLAFLAALLAGCGTTVTSSLDDVVFQVIEETTFDPSLDIDLSEFTRLETGVYIQDVVEGDGASVGPGTSAVLDYTGWLSDGQEFDSGKFTFTVGAGDVIAGFEQGMLGVKVGGTRRLIIPPELAYGPRGSGPVPGGAIVIFRVVLLEVI
jgi:FKBP-type peptidyl-prolyl cis-trans isomerase FkpA